MMDQPMPEADLGGQTEEEIRVAGHVRQLVQEVRGSANRVAHEGIWMTNIAALLGYDGVVFNTQTRQFQSNNAAGAAVKKNRIHVNKILPAVQNRLARLCKNPPRYEIRPESNDTEDKEAARLGLQTLMAMWEKLSLDEKRLLLYMWVQECGHAYIKVGWDTELGGYIEDPETGDGMFEGDVSAGIRSPFEIFTDPLCKTFEDVQRSWLIEAKLRRLEYFRDRYPKGHLVKEEGAWLLSAQYEARINSMNTRGPAGASQMDAMKNSAIELVKYEARSKKYPKGRMIVVANGILLEDKELPVGEIPFAKFDDVLIGGKYFSESLITHIRPINEAYNENRRRVTDWSGKLLAGKYSSPRGNGLAQEALNDKSGEVLLYDTVPNAPNGGAPTPIQIPNIPQWAFNEEGVCDKEINEISGISEVSKGTLPSASIPAIGMSLLVEQDDTRIGVVTEQHEHAWARVGSLILKYVEKFYVMPRKLKIAGKNLQYTVKEIKGDDLRGNTDVYVIRGSTLPGSKALKRQEIINTYSQGLLGDPADPKVREKVLSMIEFGDVAEMWQDYGLDMAQIQKGIETIEGGMPIEVSEFDNHALWLQELNRYRKGDKFKVLDPGKQAYMVEVMEQHLQFITDMMNPPQPVPVTPEELENEEMGGLPDQGMEAPPVEADLMDQQAVEGI